MKSGKGDLASANSRKDWVAILAGYKRKGIIQGSCCLSQASEIQNSGTGGMIQSRKDISPKVGNMGGTKMTEELQEEVLPGYPDETFVTYRSCRVFYKFKQQHNEWFCIVHLTGHEAAQPGYSTLGCDWFRSKGEAINWGKQIVDKCRDETRTETILHRPSVLPKRRKPDCLENSRADAD